MQNQEKSSNAVFMGRLLTQDEEIFTIGRRQSPENSTKPKTYVQKVVSILLEHFQKAFGLSLSSDMVESINAQPGALFWRYFVLDFLISNLVIAPLVVAVWRGSWGGTLALFDSVEYLRENHMTTNVGCFIVGVPISCAIQAAQFPLKSSLKYGTEAFLQASRLYAVLWINVDLLIWKAIWDSIVYYHPKDIPVAIGLLSVGLAGLMFSGGLRSMASVPVCMVLDEKQNMCTASLYLEPKREDSNLRLLWNLTISLFFEIIQMFTWYGMWIIQDHFQEVTYVHSRETTTWISLLLGCAISAVMYPVQFASAFLIEKNNGGGWPTWSRNFTNKMIDFVPNFLALVATIANFRGYWILMDLYVFPDQYNISLMTCLIVGCLLLMVLSGTCNLHAGVGNTDINDPKAQLFDVYYSTYFYLKEKHEQWISERIDIHQSLTIGEENPQTVRYQKQGQKRIETVL